MNAKLQEFLGKELSRRDFLKLVAGSLIMAVGINNFVAYFMNFNRPKIESSSQPVTHGFGASKFGR